MFRFGSIAGAYEAARFSYPVELAAAVLAFAGQPEACVEIGAGTGKATEAFTQLGVHVRCVEPDAGMATVLRSKFADQPLVSVAETTFEAWSPPNGGTPLIYCGQAWQWLDPATRLTRAARSLTPDGALALLTHQYVVVDERLDTAIRAVYQRLAPRLVPDLPDRLARPREHWLAQTLRGQHPEGQNQQTPKPQAGVRFGPVTTLEQSRLVDLPAERYLTLLDTFAPNRQLPNQVRHELLTGIGALIDQHGGMITIDLATVAALARLVGSTQN